MNLEVLLPSHVFLRREAVTRIVAETREGSFGLLPHRRDLVAMLVPGILLFETAREGEVYLAVDAGVLVKTGTDVRVSVRRAMQGSGLDTLRQEVDRAFSAEDAAAQDVRSVMARLETGFVKRVAALRDD